jgi:hypothetical protein
MTSEEITRVAFIVSWIPAKRTTTIGLSAYYSILNTAGRHRGTLLEQLPGARIRQGIFLLHNPVMNHCENCDASISV